MKSQGSGSRCRVQRRGHDGRALDVERDEYRYRAFLGNKAETCWSRVQPRGMPGVCFSPEERESIVSPSGPVQSPYLQLFFHYARPMFRGSRRFARGSRARGQCRRTVLFCFPNARVNANSTRAESPVNEKRDEISRKSNIPCIYSEILVTKGSR